MKQIAPILPTSEPRTVDEAIEWVTFSDPNWEPGPGGHVKENALSFKRILVALDETDASRNAVEWARDLAAFFQCRVALVHVNIPGEIRRLSGEYVLSGAESAPIDAARTAKARRMLDDAKATLRKANIATDALVVEGSPRSTLVEIVQEEGADLLIMGSHDRGALGRLFLGSIADIVKDHVDCSVLIARSPPRPQRVLIGVDGSPVSRIAAATGVHLARHWRAKAHVVYVVKTAGSRAHEERQEALRRALGGFDAAGLDPLVTFDVEFGGPADRLARAARRHDAQLIVTGSKPPSGPTKRTPGSLSNRLLHLARTSLLALRDRTDGTGANLD